MNSGKLLLIAYHYPPDAAVGALRPQKLSKYWLEQGWEVRVLALHPDDLELQDACRVADVQGAKITYLRACRTPVRVIHDLLRPLRHASTAGTVGSSSATKPAGTEKLSARMKRYLLAFHSFIDDQLYWSIPAIATGLHIIRKERIRLIISTSPPHSMQWIGHCLSKLTGARHIADFRDPWVPTRRLRPPEVQCAFFSDLEKKIEKKVLRHAALIVCNTQRARIDLFLRYPELKETQVAVISNGYDPEGIPAPLPSGNKDRFVIGHAGSLCLDRNPTAFLAAVGDFLRDHPAATAQLQLLFIGDSSFGNNSSLIDLAEALDIGAHLNLPGRLSHEETLKQLAQADILLLFAPDQPEQVPAKLFDYVGLKKPILALTGDGETADLVRTLSAGRIAEQDDAAMIKRALSAFYEEWSGQCSDWYKTGEAEDLEYSRLAGQYGKMLSGLLDTPRPKRGR